MPPVTKPMVLIVGAGLGGLTLAVLLEKAGSAMALGANVLPMFEQLNMLDDIMANSKEMALNQTYNESMEQISLIDYREARERCGYEARIIARPVLYELMLSRVPKHKILMNKRVLSFTQSELGVRISCSDNSSYSGDILVGADGAYSGVRQSLYKSMKEAGELPKSDQAQLTFSSTCLVGKTRSLDLSDGKYKHMEDETCRFETFIGNERPFSWVTFCMPDNSICWMVIELLDDVSGKESDNFRNSEWGPEAAEAMSNQVRHFPISSGTLGDLIDATPKELTSKVMLEEKLFDTWYGGRTVLIGDACHKMHPGAGQGAVNAIQDAIIIANLLYDLPTSTQSEITKIFSVYKDERYPLAKGAYTTSHAFGQLIAKKWINDVIRKAMNHIPAFLWRKVIDDMYGYRPVVSFLEAPEYKALSKAVPQTSLKYAKKRIEAEAKAAQKTARAI
ncbi:hypothetical protein BGX28_007494 [Mortierella sp. GBA30]|nr:hypothetical protein BGX28_007494 [Mortierella sp. GBA30]